MCDIEDGYALVKIAQFPEYYLKMCTSKILCPCGHTASQVIAEGGAIPCVGVPIAQHTEQQRAEQQKKHAMESFISLMNFTPF